MPSIILSKAASTPVDGAVDPPAEFRRVVGFGEGVAVTFEDFVTVFGVGVGFGAMVRVRLDGEVVLELHGMGPFDIHYLNPADDPTKAAAAK